MRKPQLRWNGNQLAQQQADAAFRSLKPKSKKTRPQKRERRRWEPGYPCLKCGSLETRNVLQQFAGGKTHVRMECGKCGKYLKFVSHHELEQVG